MKDKATPKIDGQPVIGTPYVPPQTGITPEKKAVMVAEAASYKAENKRLQASYDNVEADLESQSARTEVKIAYAVKDKATPKIDGKQIDHSGDFADTFAKAALKRLKDAPLVRDRFKPVNLEDPAAPNKPEAGNEMLDDVPPAVRATYDTVMAYRNESASPHMSAELARVQHLREIRDELRAIMHVIGELVDKP